LSSSARPIRGEVPLPEGRPYNLGSAQPDQTAYAEPQTRTASMRSRSNDPFQDQARTAAYVDRYATRPVSAYAPADPESPNQILGIRGLY
jgi:rare lipoprotein A